MAFTSIRFKEAWNWGGLSFRELAVRTYQARWTSTTRSTKRPSLPSSP